MEHLTTLDIETADKLLNWAQEQTLTKAVQSSYAPKRLEKWFNNGSNLGSIDGNRGTVFPCTPLEPHIGNIVVPKYLKSYNSVLLCGGNTSINWHRDHGHFEAIAIMVNLGQATFWEQLDPSDAGTQMEYMLNHGDIVKIDTKVLHKAVQVNADRYSLTFRTIRPEFMQQSLF